MPRTQLSEEAKRISSRTAEMLERVKKLHGEVISSLQLAKRQESLLKEKEEAEEHEREEREKAERLRKFLRSEEQGGASFGGETEPKQEANVPEHRPVEEKTPDVKPGETPRPAEATRPKAEEAAPEPRREERPKAEASFTKQRSDEKRQDNRRRDDARHTDRQDNRQQGDRRDSRQQGNAPRQQQGDRRDNRPLADRNQQQGQRQSRSAASSTSPASQQRERNYSNKGQYVRTFDADKKQKNKKTMMKEAAPSVTWDDEGGFGNRRKAKRQQAVQFKPEPVKIDKAVLTSETVTVRELSEKIGKPAAEIIKKLFMMGIIATINNEIDYETCELIAADYDIELELQVAKTYEEVLAEAAEEIDSEESLTERPPVVTIMGHVDHGKTSLLDAIRNSSITQGEAGGITQHIGAYTVACKGRTITFIDTPGHEAFTAMRARGAQVTDVVILVVAADDGIMPQTVEAINHSKAAGVPIIVAINKMDRPEANPDRVLQQLTEHGLLCEDWGGDTICVPVSARTHMNLDTLLEMVLLQADVLELKANPNRKARGTIIEAQLDKGRGPVATVLVQNGTLHVGDPIVAGVASGRVRAMIDDKGRRVKEAGPSQPVAVLGFDEVPSAGDEMNVADLDKLSKLVAEERRNKIKAEQQKRLSKVSLEDLFSHIAEGDVKVLNIVIKADVDGSVEAVKQSLEKLSQDEVRVKCIHGAVGAITASDVMFASASNAIVIGFNVRPDSGAKALAEQEKVDIRTYRVIYQAIEDVENAMKGLFKPVYKEVIIGTISVRNTFKVSGVGVIAGAYVSDGKLQRNAQVRVVRDGIVVHEGKIASLRRFKDDVKEVAQGYECGIGLENFNDIHEGDVMEAFIMEEVKR